MTETSGFFNSLDPSNPDRVYDASFFSKFFKYFIPDGVSVQGGGLAITASGTSMVSTVADGAAFIQGYNYNNDAPILLTHATADPTYDRIDRIVARLDRTEGVRAINIVIKQGTPAASPVELALQSDAYIVELPIARVLITHALSTISQANITDERGTLLDPIQYWTQIATINAQLANKQAFKLTDDNGYTTTTTDLNNITGTKTIALSTSVVNRPFDYGTVFQVSNTDQTKTQIAVDNYSGTTATRSYNSGGGWSSWATKANQSDLLSMVNTASFGSSGWFKDKKTGLLLQWGTISATYTPTYVAFPTGFSNNCYFIGITPNHGDTTAIANVIDKSNTAFHIQTNKSNSLYYLWFALGN
jgi:hypothetical protein